MSFYRHTIRPEKIPARLCAALLVLSIGYPGFSLAGGESRTKTVTVTSTEFAFEPDRIKADKNRPIRLVLKNQGVLSHNIRFPGLEKKTDTIQSGSETEIFLSPEPGEYTFICSVPGHKNAGMQGVLVVE